MEANRPDDKSAGHLDSQISALLERLNDSASIVDRLMEMPLPKGDLESENAEWDGVVARRLESRLAAALRSLLEQEPERKRA